MNRLLSHTHRYNDIVLIEFIKNCTNIQKLIHLTLKFKHPQVDLHLACSNIEPGSQERLYDNGSEFDVICSMAETVSFH